jgi:hypothetical protein
MQMKDLSGVTRVTLWLTFPGGFSIFCLFLANTKG